MVNYENHGIGWHTSLLIYGSGGHFELFDALKWHISGRQKNQNDMNL